MIYWALLMLLLFALVLVGIVYLGNGFSKFHCIQRIARSMPKRARIYGIMAVILLLAFCSITLNIMNGMVILLHLVMFWIIFDLIAKYILPKIRKKPSFNGKIYILGTFTLVFTFVYLCVGAYLAYHVWETDYTISTSKSVSPLKVALIADSHMGTTFDGDGFAEHLAEIQSKQPDALLIAGDFVDDDSIKVDMVRACEALGRFNTTYGVFFTFGNHDKGYYNGRDFTGEDLIDELKKNHVTVLQDEVFELNDDYMIIGRQDLSEDSRGTPRASMEELTSNIDPSKFTIVMDHQPYDYSSEMNSGVDLVVSGHTHGGQLIPINRVGVWIGANAMTYGQERHGNTSFIVTSGISDWALKFKTGCKSEYVIIDISK